MKFEDIKAAIEATPDLLNQLVSSFKDSTVKNLETAGMVIRTKEQDEQYLAAAISAQLPEKLSAAVGEEFGKAMRGIDEKIKAITGIEKKPGEKSTDYAARAIEEKKSQGGDPVTKQRITELEAAIAAKEAEFTGKIASEQKKFFDLQLNAQIDQALAGANIAVPVHLQTDEQKNAFITMQKNAVKGLFKEAFTPKADEAGAIIFYEGNTPKLSAKDGKPLAASDLIAEKFGQIFAPVGQPGKGTGSAGQGGQGSGGGTFKTIDDVHTHLQGQGLKPGSLEYMQALKTTATEAKIEI